MDTTTPSKEKAAQPLGPDGNGRVATTEEEMDIAAVAKSRRLRMGQRRLASADFWRNAEHSPIDVGPQILAADDASGQGFDFWAVLGWNPVFAPLLKRLI